MNLILLVQSCSCRLARLLLVITSYLGPDCPLADENKEDEEPSEDVEAVNSSEENIQG